MASCVINASPHDDETTKRELTALGYGVTDSLTNCCCIEETLLVVQTNAPVPRTELLAGSHKPEVRSVQY